MKKNSGVIIFLSLLFGMIFAIINFFESGISEAIIAFFVFGFIAFIGNIISHAFLIESNKQAIKNLPYDNKSEAANAVQKKSIFFHGSLEQAHESCIKSLSIIDAKLKKESSTSINAKIGMSIRSFGEKILFHLQVSEENKIKISIESRPVISTTIADYGKNFENVMKITKFLEDEEKKSNY